MWQDKKNIAIALTFSVLALLTIWSVDTGVFADEFTPPSGPPPTGNVDLNFLSNPLNTDLDINNHNIVDANDVHANRLIISGGSLDITSASALAGEHKWAFGATASRSNTATSLTSGLYAKTIINSGARPSYAVQGESNNAGGVAIYGKANTGFAVYGESVDVNTPGVYGYGKNGVIGQSNAAGGAGVYGTEGLGSYAGYFDGLVYLANGGQLHVETTGDLSPIVGVASYNNDNAGVQGYGNIGIYGGGDVIGVYGYGEQGVLAKGARTLSVLPPPGGEWEGGEPVDGLNVISQLFGIQKTQAAVGNYTAYTIGLVATGGSNGGATLTHAGLGLCALSGAKDFALGANPNYHAYCQDASGKNNYAGFFAGDVYVKDGSVQLHGTLANSNENLLYANASSAVNNSHLLKLQVSFADKFKVDKNGALWSASTLTSNGDINLNSGALLLNDGASYIDFRGGTSGPSCKSGEEGRVYYFTNYSSLCLCQGASGWVNLVPGLPNGQCTNGVWEPD